MRQEPLAPFVRPDSEVMVYTVDLGDGRVVDIEGPKDATPEQLQAVIAGQAGSAQEAPAEMAGTFADELPEQSATRLSPEDEAAYGALLRTGSTDDLSGFLQSRGLATDPAKLGQFVQERDRAKATGQPVNYDVSYSLPEKVEVDEGGAFGRGVADTLMMGTLPKAGAVVAGVQSALSGNGFSDGYARMLDQNNAAIGADEQDHPWFRLAGQLLGGLGLPSGLEGIGLKAGSEVLRAGGTMREARVAAAIAVRNRMSAVGGAYGVAHGAGSADSIPDAVVGAAVEGGLGAATGGLLGQAGKRSAVDERISQSVDDGRNVLEAAQRQNVSILPQDIGGRGIGRATQGAAQTMGGASTVKRAADRLYESFRSRVAAITGEVGTAADVGAGIKARSAARAGREAARAERSSDMVLAASGEPLDLTGAGQVIQRGATRWMRESEQKASTLYDRVAIDPEHPAKLDATRAALRYLTTGLKSNKALSRLWAENSRLRASLDALTPAEEGEELVGGGLSWEDLKRFRSIVGQVVGRPGLESDGAQMDALRKLYAGLSDDMRATAEDVGPEALAQFNRANGYFSARMNRINQTISRVLGKDNDGTPNEAISAVESALRDASSGDAAFVGRVLRTMPAEDADRIRASLVARMRGGGTFDPAAFAKAWGSISERGKSVLLPKPGLRSVMDDAAARAAAAERDPLAGKSAEQVIAGLEAMSRSRGDSARFRAQMAQLSPDEATATRSLLIDGMGRAAPGSQNADGDAFSISSFLTNWNKLTPDAKLTLFGDGEMRSHMNDLAMIADRVKASERLAGHSNTGAVNGFNATTGGLAGAAVALLTGHPIVAVGLAAPLAYQRAAAEVLTSKRLLNWLAKAPKKPNAAAQVAHVRRLSAIARAEPAIANDVLALQQRLTDAFASSPARLAADERNDSVLQRERNRTQQQAPQQGLQP